VMALLQLLILTVIPCSWYSIYIQNFEKCSSNLVHPQKDIKNIHILRSLELKAQRGKLVSSGWKTSVF
jgi:hypothetical protein